MPYRELSVFWRIQNFSLLGYFIPVKSAPFSLPCGIETGKTQKFYIEFHPSHALFLPGTLKLRPHPDKATGSSQELLPPLRVSFLAVLSTGERHIFHETGRILNGQFVEDCKRWFKRFPSLLNKRDRYLPDDSLTFLVQFTSAEPVFGANRLFSRTTVPIMKYDFEWGIDLSKGTFWKYDVSCLPLKMTLKTAVKSHRNVCEISIVRKQFGTYPVICDMFLKTDSGKKVLIGKFGVVNFKPVHFTVTKKFCLEHAKLAVRNRGALKLYFECSVDDGEPISGDFGETPFEGDDDKYRAQSGNLKPPAKTQKGSGARKEPKARCQKNDIGARAHAGGDCSTNVMNTFKEELWISYLQNLYSQQTFSDFTLKVGDRSFPVHKAILSARSAVLRAIFEADMNENCLEVTDVDADTIDRMLRFVYSGDFEESDFEGAAKLFAAAIKYQIESLKWRCIDCMVASLSAKNATGALKKEDEDVHFISYLQNLYSQQTFSDFLLKAGGRSFPVHRAVLSARSAVFRAMFEADVRENCSEVIDVDADTMDWMLRFLYNYDFQDTGVEGAAKLFAAADKYQIAELKTSCVKSLVHSLSVENVCSVLSLADTHIDQALTTKAKEFLFRNAKAVFRSDSWRRLMAEKAELASSIMHETCLR